MNSKEAFNELKREISVRGNLSTFQKRCFDIIQQDLDRLEQLEKIFGDKHICEIKARHNPTLEEVKKEWEDLGYEWRIPKEYPHMIWLVSDDDEPKWVLHIKINTQSKKYWKRWGDLSVEPFTFQEHQLLTKTFRALVRI